MGNGVAELWGAAHGVPSQPTAPGTCGSVPPNTMACPQRGCAGAEMPHPWMVGFTSSMSPSFFAVLSAAAAVGNAALVHVFTRLDHRIGVSRGR